VAGELGLNPDDVDERATFEAVPGLPPVVDLACGGMHTVALTADGRLYTWGNNDEKALGRTASAATAAPGVAEGLDGVRVVQAACGDNASFVLAADGRLFGCGTFRDMDGVIGFQPGVIHQPVFAPVASVVGTAVRRLAHSQRVRVCVRMRA
jgi:regulator of chromosome condensation